MSTVVTEGSLKCADAEVARSVSEEIDGELAAALEAFERIRPHDEESGLYAFVALGFLLRAQELQAMLSAKLEQMERRR